MEMQEGLLRERVVTFRSYNHIISQIFSDQFTLELPLFVLKALALSHEGKL